MSHILFGIGFTLLALVLLFLSGKVLIKRGWFFAWLRGCVGFGAIFLAIFLFVVTLDLASYTGAVKDHPLATVSVSEKGSQLYEVELVDVKGAIQRFELAGDQWQLDVRLLSLGPMSSFKLHQISGRYLSLEQNNTDIQTAHALWSQSVSVIWLMVDGLVKLMPFASESLEQVAFVPMSDGAIFQVYLADSELEVVPTNAQAKVAMQ